MPVTIVATVGAANANSYVLATEADAYFDARLDSADWADADADDRARALIMATNRIDQEAFGGSRSSSAQALAFPRYGCYDRDGISIDSASIPAGIKKATYELALVLLQKDFFADSGLEQFSDVAVGPISATIRSERKAGTLPAHVARELAPFLTNPPGSVRLTRG